MPSVTFPRGTSNPAVTLGLVVGRRFAGGDYLPQLWLFWVAPIVGGVLGALVYRFVFGTPEEDLERPVSGDPYAAVS